MLLYTYHAVPLVDDVVDGRQLAPYAVDHSCVAFVVVHSYVVAGLATYAARAVVGRLAVPVLEAAADYAAVIDLALVVVGPDPDFVVVRALQIENSQISNQYSITYMFRCIYYMKQ